MIELYVKVENNRLDFIIFIFISLLVRVRVMCDNMVTTVTKLSHDMSHSYDRT